MSMVNRKTRRLGLLLPLLCADPSWADPPTQELAPVYVRTTLGEQFGIADTSSEGLVDSAQLQRQVMLRPAEVLEAVPGMIVTQHSGDGKANQYFLRGFNLDHGTDFATYVNGVPVNMPSHAHGQGYSDLNFLIPELVSGIRYRKGTYAVEDGDFSAAGSARIDYYRTLKENFAEVGLGQNGYRRALIAGMAKDHLLYGLEWYENNGPWQVAENYGKLNAVLRWSEGTQRDGFSITGMLYRGQWTGTDQIASRAVDQGVDRFGSLDPSSGGMSNRYSLSGEWSASTGNTLTQAKLYAMRYELNLYSNFSYCAADFANTGTCNQGDQFEQADRRNVYGGEASKMWTHTLFGRDSDTTLGTVFRQDRIGLVGLYNTERRERISTTRQDAINQSSIGLYLQNRLQLSEHWRSIVGWRQDFYRFDVNSNLAANSGRENDSIGGPKLGLVYAPQNNLEFYANYGQGFHSNDARGATINVDPATGLPAQRVSPLVKAHGSEIGMRLAPAKSLQLAATLWQLKLDSELLFVGDAGTTEASRPSKRNGLELSAHYHPLPWLAFDGNLAFSKARFSDEDSVGSYIPGAIDQVFSGGVTVDGLGPWFANLRLRYFGPRPLIENDSVRSGSSTLANLRVGYKLTPRTQLTLDVLNLFDRQLNDIEYYYCSLLKSEVTAGAAGGTCADGSAGRDDIHFHPAEPRTVRLALRMNF
jgi:outer membrane receptor protein involved in Fe transport